MLTRMVSLSWPRAPPSSASQSAGITGVRHHARPDVYILIINLPPLHKCLKCVWKEAKKSAVDSYLDLWLINVCFSGDRETKTWASLCSDLRLGTAFPLYEWRAQAPTGTQFCTRSQRAWMEATRNYYTGKRKCSRETGVIKRGKVPSRRMSNQNPKVCKENQW